MHFETEAMATKIQCFVLVAMYWALLASLMGNSPVSAFNTFSARVLVARWAVYNLLRLNIRLVHYPPQQENNTIYQRKLSLKHAPLNGYTFYGLPCPPSRIHHVIYFSVYPPGGPNVHHFSCNASRSIYPENCHKVVEYQLHGTDKSFWCNTKIMSH